jgi:glutamate synthase (NADPH/NADH) small chain
MGKVTGFKEFARDNGDYKPADARINNYEDIFIPVDDTEIKVQASRCMDCGVPFCMSNCPLGNIIPDFNDLVYNDEWKKALEVLHTTNNFPEFTGKICPALCEGGCVLGIIKDPITIEHIELAIVEKGWAEDWIKPEPPAVKTGKKVGIIGSGPAGMAAAQQLARVGHDVTLFERADEIGGAMRYGIPDYKLPKKYIQRRVDQMIAEGVVMKTSTNVGVDVSVDELKETFDVLCLTGGSTEPRDLTISGRDLSGIHFAMDFLPQSNKRVAGQEIPSASEITAKGKKIVVIGGGDTGSDCIGTSLRQGAIDVTQLELLPMPPKERDNSQPWPVFPRLYKTSSSHDEAEATLNKDIRMFSIGTKEFVGEDGKVTGLKCIELLWEEVDGRWNMTEVEGSEFIIEADLILFAMGFLHPQHTGLLDSLDVDYDPRGNVSANNHYQTSIPGVFVAGDMRRGQSLVVHALAEGRKLAYEVDLFLMGSTYLRSSLK